MKTTNFLQYNNSLNGRNMSHSLMHVIIKLFRVRKPYLLKTKVDVAIMTGHPVL